MFNAFGELGYDTVDPNTDRQIGVTSCPSVIKGNERQSTATAFLSPEVRKRPNLNISTLSYVTKIVIDNVTKTAVGVEFIKNQTKYVANAGKEVIISGKYK